jgi:hypothetical protein
MATTDESRRLVMITLRSKHLTRPGSRMSEQGEVNDAKLYQLQRKDGSVGDTSKTKSGSHPRISSTLLLLTELGRWSLRGRSFGPARRRSVPRTPRPAPAQRFGIAIRHPYCAAPATAENGREGSIAPAASLALMGSTRAALQKRISRERPTSQQFQLAPCRDLSRHLYKNIFIGVALSKRG